MKQCPVCQSTFEDRVDFCFQDGSPLETIDAAADPTALPDPGASTPSIADAPTQVRKKPRGRGMFARPSVADMLTVSGTHVPPAGGNRVVADAPQTTLGTPTVIDETELDPASTPASPPSPVEVIESKVVEEERNTEPDVSEVDTVVDPSELPDPSYVPDVEPPGTKPDVSQGGNFGADRWSASIEVPVSPAAVDVPNIDESVDDSDVAPPGLEPDEKAVSLDDSWFGEGSELEEDVDVPESAELPAVDPVEDPGFADVLESDDVGFDDSSWSAGGAPSTGDAKIPRGLVFGGIGLIAAAVMLTVVFSSDEPSALPPPVEVAEAVVEPPPPPPPPPAPAEPENTAEDDAGLDELEPGEVPAIEDAVADADVEEDDEEQGAAVAVIPAPVVVPPAEPPPTPAASPPPAPAPAPAAPEPAPTRTAKANPPSVWTGSPAPAEPAPASVPSSNPWGTPSETPSRGRLTISTEPSQAMVFIDDRQIGRSPTSTEVSYGTHNVRVEKVDYEKETRVVSVQASEVSVPIRLVPSELIGRCNLLGEVGAAVAMNGRQIGSLPLSVDCSPGVHRFDVQPAAGGEPFTLSRSVTFVHAGETENLFLTP